jgi:hypothetical protein
MQPLTQYDETHQFSNMGHEIVVVVKVMPFIGPKKAYAMTALCETHPASLVK